MDFDFNDNDDFIAAQPQNNKKRNFEQISESSEDLDSNGVDSSELIELQSDLHYSIVRISEQKGEKLGVTYSKEFVGSVNNLLAGFIETLSDDLYHFSKHAKRKTVTKDDIILCARKSNNLTGLLNNKVNELQQERDLRKKNNPPKKKQNVNP